MENIGCAPILSSLAGAFLSGTTPTTGRAVPSDVDAAVEAALAAIEPAFTLVFVLVFEFASVGAAFSEDDDGSEDVGGDGDDIDDGSPEPVLL